MIKHHALLAYAGTLPFLVGALCSLLSVQQLAFIGSLEEMISSYGLIIATFMAGSYWGLSFSKHNHKPMLAISSNVVTVLLWFAYLWLSFTFICISLIAAFIAYLYLDRQLLKLSIISDTYFKLRCKVTAIVLLCLTLSIFSL